MKLSKREKVFIFILITFIVSFLLYNFIIKPQRESLGMLKSDMSMKLQELSVLKQEIASESKLYIELLSLEDHVYEKADKFFTNVTQEDIILLTEEISDITKLQIHNIDFPESRVEELILLDYEVGSQDEEKLKEIKETIEDNDEEGKPKIDLKVYSINLEYEGYYYSFIDFMKKISDYKKKIIVNDIRVSKDEDGYLKGNIILDFYSIEDILDNEEELYVFDSNLDYATGDPFSQFEDYIVNDRPLDQENNDAYKDKNIDEDELQTLEIDNSDSSYDATKNILEEFEDTGKDKGKSESKGKTELIDRSVTVIDFEKEETMFFVADNKDIKGSIDLNKKEKTQGESSLNVRYDFIEKRKDNIANISFNNNVLMKDPPQSLLLSVYSIEESETTLGVVIRDRNGIDYKLDLTKNLNWNGWKTIGIDLPVGIEYPAIIEKIYIKTDDLYDKLTGDLLIDDLRLIYNDY